MATKFHMGDMVFSHHFGKGIVVGIDDNPYFIYPIHVRWVETTKPRFGRCDIFTSSGQYSVNVTTNTDFDIIPVEEAGKEMGQIASVVDSNIVKKMKEDNKKMSPDDEVFHVGDRVHTMFNGYGTIIETHGAAPDYPILVKWDSETNTLSEETSTYTADGEYYARNHDPESMLTVVKPEKFQIGDRVFAPFHRYGTVVAIDDSDKSYPITVKWDESRYKIGIDLSTFTEDGFLFQSDKTENTKITKVKADMEFKEKNDGTIERMEDALNKKVEDAVNPAHYKVEGLPEAIDIINHLMHREEYEGFLWGNILKYAYRFGRKGDKAETAGKIEWYAKQLKELEEEHK